MFSQVSWISFFIVCASCQDIECPKTIRTFDELKCANKENIQIIRVQEGKLTHLDVNMVEDMVGVKTIDLRSNDIFYINPEVFKIIRKVIKIDLTNNLLTSIDEDTFGYLEELGSLHLSNNLLETIDSNSFSGLPKIQIIELKNNKIREISENAFRVNSTIWWLSLRNNYIKNISFVRHLFNLSKLDCTFNEIETIPEDAFENVTKVKDFQCMNNRIEDITFLKHLIKLDYLDLSNNSIKNIPVTTFSELKELEKIIMSNNRLKFIGTGTFAKLEKLEVLVLNNNELTTIGEIFDNLPNLKSFHVINNNLEKLSNGITDNSNNFILYLDGNNWSCQFIKHVYNKLPNRLKFTPRNNVTNYNNIPCVDKELKPRLSNEIEIINKKIDPPTNSSEFFQTYILPFSIAVVILLGICVITYFVILFMKGLRNSNNQYATDIPMSTFYMPSSNKSDINGYLEPRRVPCEEGIYEEIDSVDSLSFANSLTHIPAKENEYIQIK